VRPYDLPEFDIPRHGRKTKLYRAVLKMHGPLTGHYLATRLVEAVDPDDASGRAAEIETARQRGVEASGGMGHTVHGVQLIRRVAA
jgi:hypothetical protein